MIRTLLFLGVFALFPVSLAQPNNTLAQQTSPCPEGSTEPCTMGTPLFTQFLVHRIPPDMVYAYQDGFVGKDGVGGSYIEEFVPKGQTLDNWQEMLTVRAEEGMALNPNITAEKYAALLVDTYRKSCPKTFNGADAGTTSFNGYDAKIVLAGCGQSAGPSAGYSEVNMFVVIRAAREMMLVQWGVREPAKAQKPELEPEFWKARLDTLMPIYVCDTLPGSQEMDQSCLQGGS